MPCYSVASPAAAPHVRTCLKSWRWKDARASILSHVGVVQGGDSPVFGSARTLCEEKGPVWVVVTSAAPPSLLHQISASNSPDVNYYQPIHTITHLHLTSRCRHFEWIQKATIHVPQRMIKSWTSYVTYVVTEGLQVICMTLDVRLMTHTQVMKQV